MSRSEASGKLRRVEQEIPRHSLARSSSFIFSLVRARSKEIINAQSLRRKLSGRANIRIKLGIDPTTPDLHLGHVVPLRMLKIFQDAGHTAILIIGDFTAAIGDPSGRISARKQLSREEVKANERTYLKQVGGILNLKKTEIRHNSEWYAKMKLATFLGLLRQFSLKSAWEREDFQKRLSAGKPVQLHEAMYHVLQAYDSVMVRADVELGSMDQKLNILAGRELQKKLVPHTPPQDIVLTPYLIGLDGTQKMSKSVGNTIALNDSAADMFGKTMSIPDGLIVNYAEFAVWMRADEVEVLRTRLGHENPRDVKLDLAEAVSALYHGKPSAARARAEFMATFSQRRVPSSVPRVRIPTGSYAPLELFNALKQATSKSEARRLISGGALEVDGHVVAPSDRAMVIRSGSVIRIGKKKFFRVR